MKYRVGLTDKKLESTNRFAKVTNGLHKYSSNNGKRENGPFSRTVVSKNGTTKNGKGKPKTPFRLAMIKLFYILVGIGFFVAAVGMIAAGIYLKKLEAELPDAGKLLDRKSAYSTEVYDRNGKLLYTFHGADENREFVSINDIPEHTKWALLSAEDIEFYQHKGLDFAGIAKSLYVNLTKGEILRGSSTISQQLVKITLLTDTLGTDAARQKSYIRKLKEMVITMQMEQRLTKDQILELYMNEVPLGGVNYGFQAAAKAYFGKDVKSLDLAESAMLAGLIQSPSYYSPIFGVRPDLAVERQTYVLDQMLKHKDLTGVTEEDIAKAKEEKLVYKSADVNILAPHFVFYIKQKLVEQFGEEVVDKGGLKVTTTLDYSTQKIAQEEIKNGIAKYGKKYNVNNGAMVVLDPKNGDILAMVGSIDYFAPKNRKIDGNVNITVSPRQMGSSVKPYTYLTAFHMGYGPWLLTPDIKEFTFGSYKLDNWDNKFYGLMTAREAIVESRNIPAVYTMQLIGVDSFIKTAETLGITTLKDRSRYGLSLTLGAAEMTLLEHTGGYTVFATGGIKRDIRGILKVVDSQGKVLIDNKENPGKRVWDEKEIYMLNWVLCDMGGFGDRTLARDFYYNGRPMFCGKTGTTNGPRDLTAFMYHKNLVVGVWAGNNDNTETPGAWSSTVPQPIAGSFLNRVANKYKPESFTRPAGVVSGQVCNDSGMVPGKDTNCKKVNTVYIVGKGPAVDTREKITICKDRDVVASNPDTARKFGVAVDAILFKKELENKLQQANFEKYIRGLKTARYFTTMPDTGDCTIPLGTDNAPVADITAPAAGTTVNAGSTVNISVNARALESITKLELYWDNALITNLTSAPYSYTYTVPNGTSAGTHTIKAVVYDNYNKTGSDSVTVNVTLPPVNISITSPANGSAISNAPVTLSASTSGIGVTRVEFHITGPSGYSTTISDTNSSDSWSANWVVASLANGVYQITATAFRGGETFTSSTIAVSKQ